jgi:hypothetical protein
MFIPDVEIEETLIPVSNGYVEMDTPTQHWFKLQIVHSLTQPTLETLYVLQMLDLQCKWVFFTLWRQK